MEMENSLLEHLKNFPVNEELLSGLSLNKLEQACGAWSLSNVEMKEIGKYTEDVMELWNHCEFNKDKFFHILDFIPPSGFLYRLIHSNLIYPDGDYNIGYLRRKRILESMKGAKNGNAGKKS